MSDPPDDGSQLGGISPNPLDPLAVVGGDDVGDQVMEILEELRKRARSLREYSDQLLDQVEGMRELVLSLSSEGLARREAEERIAVLEAERDVLARQLGKVRRENEEELSLARERIKGLQTELSLAAKHATPIPGEPRAAQESRGSSALIEEPVVETVGAKQRRVTLKGRPRPKSRPPRVPGPSELSASANRAEEDGDADLWSLDDEQPWTDGAASRGAAAEEAPQSTEEAFAGLLDDELELAVDSMQVESGSEGGTDVGAMPAFAEAELELEPVPEVAKAEPLSSERAKDTKGGKGVKTSSASVTLALEDLLSSYLEDE